MVSEHDTEDSPAPRESTDPLFPGPAPAPSKSSGTDPGFLFSSGAMLAASPHEARVSDTLPAAEAAHDQPAPARVGPAARARPESDPPVSRSKARAESIDELIDGLGGEAALPKKPKASTPPSAMGNEARSSSARKPSSPVPASAPLPAVLIRDDSDPAAHDGEGRGDRRSDPTVLTPLVMARRSRATTWIAGALGVLLAVVMLALFRQVARSDDPIAPVTTQATAGTAPPRERATVAPATKITPAIATTAEPVQARSGEPVDNKHPNAARLVEPSSTPPARSAPPTAPSSNGLEDFRKTIRQ